MNNLTCLECIIISRYSTNNILLVINGYILVLNILMKNRKFNNNQGIYLTSR